VSATLVTLAEAREMRRLYVEEGLSVVRVAKAMGRSCGAVTHSLKSLGVPRRSQSVSEAEADRMVALYAEGLSMTEVSGLTGRALASVNRTLHARGVRVHPPGRNLHGTAQRTPHDQVERILETYRRTRSQRQTARILGFSYSRVRYHLIHAGEPLVPRSEVNARVRRLPPEREARVCRLYAEGVPVGDICRMVDVGRTTVANVVRRNGVPLRGRSGGVRQAWAKRQGVALVAAA
jgi:DNA-binding CsgD family transcriptional regulator/predicted transcriptional regulator